MTKAGDHWSLLCSLDFLQYCLTEELGAPGGGRGSVEGAVFSGQLHSGAQAGFQWLRFSNSCGFELLPSQRSPSASVCSSLPEGLSDHSKNGSLLLNASCVPVTAWHSSHLLSWPRCLG